MTVPAISVLMPVYNGEAHLREAIDSILAQGFVNFEFIIINDGSTDATQDILEEYAKQDTRIIILKNDQNIKISASLNKGLKIARAPLIARMDADDWSYPDRFQRQYDCLLQNPQIALCGSWVSVYETGDIWRYPTSDAQIRVQILFGNPFAHSAVIFRKEILAQLTHWYDESFPPCEDYDLWERFSQLNILFYNMPEILLRYRTHPDKNRSDYRCKMIKRADEVRIRQIKHLGINPTPRECLLHNILAGITEPRHFLEIFAAKLWTRKLLTKNRKKNIFDQKYLSNELQAMQENLSHNFDVKNIACHDQNSTLKLVKYLRHFVKNFYKQT